MRTLVTNEKRIEDITLDNIKNGEVTLLQLNEIYNKRPSNHSLKV